MRKIFFLLGLFLALPIYASIPGKTYKVTILHTNDHHGHFWKSKYGEGGLAARKTLVDQIRKEVQGSGGHVLLLSGGDINTGVPESDLQDAEPDFLGMRALGYDAMALGNHEFDKPFEVLLKQRKWAGFPFLSANTFYGEGGEGEQKGKRPFLAAVRKNLGGLKVAIVGFTTEDTRKIANPKVTQKLRFVSPIEVARTLLPELRSAGAELVIAATHMGHYPDGKHGHKAPGDITLARSLKPGLLDVIVGGHSHTELKEQLKVNGTHIVQAGFWGRYLGRLDLEFLNGEVIHAQSRLLPINLQVKDESTGKWKPMASPVREDPDLLKRLEPFQERGTELVGVQVGILKGERMLSRYEAEGKETNLGRLMAESTRVFAKADVGMINPGGVRKGLDAGVIRYKDLLEVWPFSDTVCYADMKGTQLIAYLKNLPTNRKHHFAGIQVKVDSSGSIVDARVRGEPIKKNGTYRFALTSFAGQGQGDYPRLNDHPNYVDKGVTPAEALKEYFENRKTIHSADFAQEMYVSK